MYNMRSLSLLFSIAAPLVAAAGLGDSSLVTHVNSLDLSFSFNPVKESYWTGFPHHRRTPFAVSPDGKSAFIAYLDDSETDVHIQQVSPTDFSAVGTAVTVTGAKEAGGLVAHNDGFALLTNEALPSGTADAPADSTPVPVLYKYTNGEQAFKTFLGGPGVHTADGLAAATDLNGDLVYSEASGLYGAYFVVTDYTGWAEGHFGDSVQYVSDNGTLETLAASSSWGCSHNTGIAFEAADAPPYASICAEDQGAIWLNTETRGMSNTGVKISNENTTNGGSGEPMGGMSGSYSNLARFQDADSYIFAWVSRGAALLEENTWMGDGYTSAINRTNGRNVAIAQFTDKDTIVGGQASSTIGATDGDSQINWITSGTADCSNAHVATFDGTNALVTWEEIANPQCDFVAMGCQGEFTGAYYQLVNNGAKVGEPIKSTDTYVAGDMVTMADGRICWPYVSMTWSLELSAATTAASTKQMSFACISSGDSANTTSTATTAAASASSAAAATSSVATQVAAVSSSSSAPAASSLSAAAPVSSAVASSSPAAESSTAVVVSSAAPSSAIPSSTSAQAQSSAAPATTFATVVSSAAASSAAVSVSAASTPVSTALTTSAATSAAASASASATGGRHWGGYGNGSAPWYAYWRKIVARI